MRVALQDKNNIHRWSCDPVEISAGPDQACAEVFMAASEAPSGTPVCDESRKKK